ncbi:hypothetical protein PROFUN_11591 [Planoprotostelium fungivorum]|uniref:Uncharacterized protein n=1 Tax=Planoprotostelium fungivorum TaxID=1890364 RepID=A0A2P6N9T3_9EUKA|nr:hypothetical protein PROFUN_11591 [Planoprotostelium fungivorum]
MTDTQGTLGLGQDSKPKTDLLDALENAEISYGEDPVLEDLITHCETICYPEHCGVAAYDTTKEHIWSFCRRYKKDKLEDLLQEITKNEDQTQSDWDLEEYLHDNWDNVLRLLKLFREQVEEYIERGEKKDESK